MRSRGARSLSMLQSYISSFSDKFLAFAGDDLGQEILELLVKMSPTDEETTKFQEYQGDPSLRMRLSAWTLCFTEHHSGKSCSTSRVP
jgi:hypothetical protein